MRLAAPDAGTVVILLHSLLLAYLVAMSAAPAGSSGAPPAAAASAFSMRGSSGTSGRHILVTGGSGYIGSHTVIHLLQAGHEVTIVDSLANSSPVALQRLVELAQGKQPHFHQVDLRHKDKLEDVFKLHKFDACIHFAGLKVSLATDTRTPQLGMHQKIC
jgi:NADPH:quinone reductase-like Zn-dependent oxidoreductase